MILNKIKEMLYVRHLSTMSDDKLESYFIEAYESENTNHWYTLVEAAHTVGPNTFSILQRIVNDRDTRDLKVEGSTL